MSTTIIDLEKIVNSGLTTAIKKSEIIYNQLFITLNVENLISSILFLKTNEKCKFKSELCRLRLGRWNNKKK